MVLWRIDQRLEYIHNNPVEAGIVLSPEDYLYSSAINYAGLPEKLPRSDIDLMNIREFYNGSLKTATIKGTSDPAEHLRQLRGLQGVINITTFDKPFGFPASFIDCRNGEG